MRLIELKGAPASYTATIPICRFFPDDATGAWTLQDATALVNVVAGAAMSGTALGFVRTPIRAVLQLSESGAWELVDARPVTITTAAEAMHCLTASPAVREWADCILNSLLRQAEGLPLGPLNDFVRDVLADGRIRDLFSNLSTTYESLYPKHGGLLVQATEEMRSAGQLAQLRMFSPSETTVCEVGGLFQGLAGKVPGIDVLEENLAVLAKHDPWAAAELSACFEHAAFGHFAFAASKSPVARLLSLAGLCARLPWGPFDSDSDQAEPAHATGRATPDGRLAAEVHVP